MRHLLWLTAGLAWVGLSDAVLAAPVPTPQWYSGFEQGFPGEWLDYDGGSYSASGTVNPGKTEAWTIVDKQQFPDVFAGNHAYKGWIIDANPPGESHRAYPVIHCDIPSPLVNSFMVYLDVDYNQLDVPDWIHFATWANNEDWEVHTMSVCDRKLEMAHLSWSYIGPEPQPDFPLNQWVRLTVYIDYPPNGTGMVHVWQDGVPVLEGAYTARSGQSLMRAHWGMYASAEITQGVQYNDEIQIWSLSDPLTDFSMEPPSPYTTPAADGGPTPQDSGSNDAISNDTAKIADAGLSDAPAADTLAADGQVMGDASSEKRGSDDGCGCRLVERRGPTEGLLGLLMFLALVVLRRFHARR